MEEQKKETPKRKIFEVAEKPQEYVPKKKKKWVKVNKY